MAGCVSCSAECKSIAIRRCVVWSSVGAAVDSEAPLELQEKSFVSFLSHSLLLLDGCLDHVNTMSTIHTGTRTRRPPPTPMYNYSLTELSLVNYAREFISETGGGWKYFDIEWTRSGSLSRI